MSRRRPRAEHGSVGVRLAIVFVIVAAVLAVVFYGADAYVHGRVERDVAARLQPELGTPRRPVVDIAGRPFLTQVAGRRMREVHVVADEVGQTNGGALPIQHADLTLHDVTTTDWWKTMNVADAEGTALVGFDALKQAAGTPLTYVGNGRFSIDGDQTLYGVTVRAKVTGRLALDADRQTVSLADPSVEVGSYALPDVVAAQLIKAVVRPVPLEGVPFGLRVTSIDARDDGLHVGLGGRDIPVHR